MRIGLIPESDDDEASVDEELRASAEAIQKATIPLQFIRLEGEPILSLPEAEEPVPEPTKKSTKKKG